MARICNTAASRNHGRPPRKQLRPQQLAPKTLPGSPPGTLPPGMAPPATPQRTVLPPPGGKRLRRQRRYRPGVVALRCELKRPRRRAVAPV